jgi:ABC-2 type transport system ATP-binding protein
MNLTHAIDASDLTKSYGEVRALDGVSLAIEPGTLFALLGPNGAGKSTTVRILTTLAVPDSGQVRVAGIDALREPARVRRAIGVVGQKHGSDPQATGRENLELQGTLYGLHGAALRRRCGELLEQFGIAHAADRVVRTYSGGMQRRLDVAMGLMHEPHVLFLDEPTTGLDPQSRLEVWRTVQALAGQGTTVPLTTQYLDEAEHLADRIAILHEGRIIADGTLAELKALLPPTEIEYVEKQPTLEEIFLAIVGHDTHH